MSEQTNIEHFIANKEARSIVILLEIVHNSPEGIRPGLRPRRLSILQAD
jgi:hypothetical protein